jgi:hypothetical protein
LKAKPTIAAAADERFILEFRSLFVIVVVA